ncbi:hypothetical protein HDU67_008046 [Dinochytrium kinnereticum]|nr:hypothetical protein HDU67_008046 [Dinochytrium kinnereticum]
MCLVGERAVVSTIAPHFGEEGCLQEKLNSSGQNWEIAHKKEGFDLTTEELAGWMMKLQEAGCHNINFVTPEHVVPQVALAICSAARQGLNIPIVYNTSAYDCEDSLALMDGLVDIYMPDFKVWNNETAARLLKANDYPDVARKAILEMNRQVGFLRFTGDGVAKKGILIRHLVMPGKVGEGVKIMRWIAKEIGSDTYVHIMEQYKPDAHVGKKDDKRSGDIRTRYEEINMPTTIDEVEVVKMAAEIWAGVTEAVYETSTVLQQHDGGAKFVPPSSMSRIQRLASSALKPVTIAVYANFVENAADPSAQ